jgi:DNA-binding protein HU-beta
MKKNKINKSEFIIILAEKLGITQNQAEKFLQTTINIVTENLEKEREVNLTGFGNFKIARRKARKGINPKTGKDMQIDSSISVGFKPGKTLKDTVKKAIKN